MGRARRTLDRKALRDQSEAAERLKETEESEGAEDEEEEDDEEDEESDELEGSGDEDEESGDEDEDEEERPKKKKKAPAKPKTTKPRTRAVKVVRMKVVWGVFNNSHVCVEEFDYPNRSDADELALKYTTDKKSGHPYFVQPVKKPME